MNIFHKVALQGLRKNRTRTFVTVVGVALSAALFTTIATFGTSLLAYLIQGSVAKCGNWHIDFVDVDAGFVEERQKDPEVTDAAALENMGYALLDGAESAEKPYLFLAGFTDETFSRLPVTLISGRLPQNDGEILIPNHVSIKAGVRIPVGEVVELDVGSRESRRREGQEESCESGRREGQEESCESGRQEGQESSYESAARPLNQHDPYREGEILVPVETKQYLVVGTYERAEFEEHDSPGYTVITRAEGIRGSGRYSLFLTLSDPKKVKAYEEKFEGTVPFVLNEDVLRFYGVSDNRLFNAIVLAAGGTLTAIIMIGSVFLIYNAFHISLSERMHQFGILMSVGATKKQLRNSVLFEGLCIGAMGIPFGMAVGIGGVALILPLVEKNFAVISASRVPLKLAVSVPALAAAAAVTLVTILISAYIPARKAAAIPVMDCIRQTGEVRLETKKVRTSKLAGRIYGLEGVLALKNFRRNKRRYRSVILSLTLSVVLFVSGTAFGSTLKGIAKVLTVEADGDISFYAEAAAEEELLGLYDKLKTVEGVRESTWQTNALYSGVAEGLPEQFFSGQETGELPEHFWGSQETGELPEHFWGSQETGELPEQFSGGQGQAVDGTVDREKARIPVHAQFIEDSIYEKFIETMGFSKEEYSGPDGNVLSLFVDTSEHETFLWASRWSLLSILLMETGKCRSVQLWWIPILWICCPSIPHPVI